MAFLGPAKIWAECATSPTVNARQVIVKFEGGDISRNMADFFKDLWELSSLPCTKLTLPKDTVSLEQMLKEERILPAGYTPEIASLLCEMNSEQCKDSKISPDQGDDYKAPGVFFRPYFYLQEVPVLPGEKVPDAVLKRLKIQPPKSTADAREFFDAIRQRNFDFSVPFTRKNGTGKEERYIILPSIGYAAELTLPNEFSERHMRVSAAIERAELSVANKIEHIRAHAVPAKDLANDIRDKIKSAAEKVIERIGYVKPQRQFFREEQPKVIVADQGIDENHPFLKDPPPPTNTIDQYLAQPAQCDLKTSHGTHVSGIIAAQIPELLEGIARGSMLSPWKFDVINPIYGEFAEFLQDNRQSDAKIVNISVDFPTLSKPEDKTNFRRTVDRTRNFLFVLAAGNDRSTLDPTTVPVPVSAYSAKNVIVVGALDSDFTNLWNESNRGREIVHIVAPGRDIYSLCSSGTVGSLNGTSQAAAYVSGAAAYLARDGMRFPWEIKARLMYTSDIISSLSGTIASGRLNISRALNWNSDKICLLVNTTDEHSCSRWIQGTVEFGLLKDGTKFMPFTPLRIPHENGTKSVLADQILRIYGRPLAYTVFITDGEKVERLDQVSKIKPNVTNAEDPLATLPLAVRVNGETYSLNLVGDYVRRN